MTPALKCVPPFDKPTSEELSESAFGYLKSEINELKSLKTILTLGQIAFNACLKLYNLKKDFKFVHGAKYKISKNIEIVACYHPSPRNVNTKRIDEQKMLSVLENL